MADGPLAYVEFAPDGTELHVYRASAFGMCDQALMLSLHGVPGQPPPQAIQSRFAEGHDNEDRILTMLEDANPQMSLQPLSHQETVELRFANAIIRGHIDGIVTHGDYRYLVEAKAFGGKSDVFWKQWLAAAETETRFPSGGLWDKYALQFSTYCHALGIPGCFVAGHKRYHEDGTAGDEDHGIVYEINYRWFALDQLPVPRITIMQRIMHLEKLARDGMPQDDCSKGEYPCPYYQFHAEKDAGADDVLVLEDAKLHDLIEEVHKKRKYAEGPVKAKELAEKALKAYVAEIGRNVDGAKTRVGKHVIVWHVQNVPAGIVERKAFSKSYPTFTEAK